MEHLEFGEIFQHIIPAMKLKKISDDFAKALIHNYVNQLIYNGGIINASYQFKAAQLKTQLKQVVSLSAVNLLIRSISDRRSMYETCNVSPDHSVPEKSIEYLK